MNEDTMTPEQWAQTEEAGYVAAIIKGAPYTRHALKDGEKVAVCGRKPGARSPGSTHRNRAGWKGFFPKGSGRIINCKACAEKLLDRAGAPSSRADRVHELVNAGDLPGMSEAFDARMGAACWTDRAYAQDASLWAAAWKAALRAQAQPVRQPLSDEQIAVDAFMQHKHTPGTIGLEVFRRGVRYAERAHHIDAALRAQAEQPVEGAVYDASMGSWSVTMVQRGSEDAHCAKYGGKRLYTAPVPPLMQLTVHPDGSISVTPVPATVPACPVRADQVGDLKALLRSAGGHLAWWQVNDVAGVVEALLKDGYSTAVAVAEKVAAERMRSLGEYTRQGVRYVAMPERGCAGCAFGPGSIECHDAPSCTGNYRDDGIDIIWVESVETKKNGG